MTSASIARATVRACTWNTSTVSDVNPHYLDHVVKLSETSDIEASEDIVSGTGMKLLAKGAKIDARARERLLEFRLSKPLENMMRVVGGPDPAVFHPLAETLLARHALLRLGFSEDAAQRAVALFRRHDEAQLDAQYAVHQDEALLIQTSVQAAAQLQELFEADSAASEREGKQ